MLGLISFKLSESQKIYFLPFRTESIDVESLEILKRLGFRTNLTKFHVTKGGTKKKTHQYFSQLNKDLLNKLYNVYKLDFVFFGYSFDEYSKAQI